MIEFTMLMLAMICLIGILSQWLAWWLKLPSILFLLLAGIVLGPTTGILDPDLIFGDILFPIVSLSVAIILFEGGLTLRLYEVKSVGRVVWNLVTIGAGITWVAIAISTHYFLGFTWALSYLFGALVVVTGPTVIVPLLRTVRPNARLANILRWEGILIDPLGALLAVLVFNYIVSGLQSNPLFTFGAMVISGIVVGGVGAVILAVILRRHLMPEYLHDVAALAFVLTVYTIANYIAHESGLLAVTLMGMILANLKNMPIEGILDFKESLSVLLISVLFIVLAARLDFADFATIGWGAVGIVLVILFVARPLSVMASSIGAGLSLKEQLLLSWIAPRGIVAAAVSALFAMRLDEVGEAEAHLLIPLTFLVIIVTVVLQSLTARPLATALDLAEPEPRGVLIVGAHAVARSIAHELIKYDFRVVLADTNWTEISKARMEGIDTFFGNIVSEHADRHLDLVGIGYLLAMSNRPALNVLACQRYRTEFGGNKVSRIQVDEEKDVSDKLSITGEVTGSLLFGKDVTDGVLATMIEQGAEIRCTNLSENYDYSAYNTYYDNRLIPLFAFDDKTRLVVFTDSDDFEPGADWRVISLIPQDQVDKEAAVESDASQA